MELQKQCEAYHEDNIYIWCSRVKTIALPKLGCSQKVKRFLSMICDVCYVALFLEASFQNALIHGIICSIN